MMRRGGYTIMEVLVTVVILAVLASIALPNTTRTLQVGYRRAARDILLTTYAGEQVYTAINGTPGVPVYKVPVSAATTETAWSANLYMDNPNALAASLPVNFAIKDGSTGDTQTFRAFAHTKVNGVDVCMWISQSGTLCPDAGGCPAVCSGFGLCPTDFSCPSYWNP